MVQQITPQGLLCPVCRVDLVMSDRQGIEIDYCPKCRGVWLDRGELDKIIERSIGDMAPRANEGGYPSMPQGKHGGGHDERRSGGHHGRRKGFLRELFD